VEAGVWFLLVKTYSRGGLVTAVAALVAFFGLRGLRGTGDSPVGLGSSSTGFQPVGFQDKTRAGRPWHSNHTGESPVPLESMGWKPMLRKPHGQDARATFTGWKPVLLRIIIRLAFVAALCIALGFASRVSPSYIAQDKSVINRLEMWQGALVMMKDSPWLGWGNNNGGFAYINWYQPQSMTSRPIGFVNSFLDIGVEFGTPALFAVLWIWFWLMLVALKVMGASSSRSWEQDAPLTLPAFLILAAWGVANIFTSLWHETALWIVPAGCAIYILAVWWRKGGTDIPVCAIFSRILRICTDRFRGRRPTVCHVCATFTLSAACIIILLSAGWAFSGKYEWIARPSMGTDKITVIKRASLPVGASLATPADGKQASKQGVASDAPTCVYADGAVFGRYFGKTFRSIAARTTGERFEIYPPWTRNLEKPNPETKRIIYTGFQASWLGRRNVLSSQEVVIFYPTVFPSIEAADIGAARVSLYMPPASASEYNLAWRRWAQRNKVQIINSSREALPLW